MLALVARLPRYVVVLVADSRDAIDRCVSEEKSMQCNVNAPLFVLAISLFGNVC